MSFIERAIESAGLGAVLPARRRGDLAMVRSLFAVRPDVDILVLGALADAVRAEECGDVVRIHPRAQDEALPDGVTWIARTDRTELALLRQIALCRILLPRGARIGIGLRIRGTGAALACAASSGLMRCSSTMRSSTRSRPARAASG